ncbi:MAG: peptidase U32 family protein [Promethearchaeota archaeon]
MNNKVSKVELMAPLKNYKSLNAVLKSADAVYFGVESLNMRMFSDNFKLKDLTKIVTFCHKNSIKAYLTTNVIIYENEIDLTNKILTKASEAGIDAVIVHDIGAIRLAKEKGLKFHISTQANISNSLSAKFYESLGAERLILARELSLNQIKEIKNKVNRSQIEVFVHGAQCTSISGRCYFSAELCASQEYSANRGRCVQPCRRRWHVFDDQNNELLYDGVFFINTKDLCMIEYIPTLIEANIDAFKIEGRMRDPIYIEEVTKCYREAIDAYYDGNFSKQKSQEWLERLKKVYNRGFSTGFYFELPKGSEIERDQEGNISKFKKLEIGKVLSYYPEKKAAKILLTSGKLKLGEEIYIIGTHTETFLRQSISSIQIKQKKNLTETPMVSKGKLITVGIVVDKPVKKNDKVYKLLKKNLEQI